MKIFVFNLITKFLILLCGVNALAAGHESVSCSGGFESTTQVNSQTVLHEADQSSCGIPTESEQSSENRRHSDESHHCHLGHCTFILDNISVIFPDVIISGIELRTDSFSSVTSPILQRPPLS